MSEVQGSIHVGVGKIAKPLWVFLFDLFRGETTQFVL